MRTRILLCLTLLMVPLAVQAQTSDGTLYVKQFPGSDVGTKIANAQAACPTSLTVPCLLVIDPSLAAYNPGTKPLLRANVYLIDWRTGLPTYSQGTITGVPVPILPSPPSLPPVTGTPFVLLNGVSATDCSVGGGSFTVLCLQTPSGPVAVGSALSIPGLSSDGASPGGIDVTGNVNAGSLGSVLIAGTTQYPDIGSAISALPSTGGTVVTPPNYAPSLTNLAVGTATKPVTLLLGQNSNITVTGSTGIQVFKGSSIQCQSASPAACNITCSETGSVGSCITNGTQDGTQQYFNIKGIFVHCSSTVTYTNGCVYVNAVFVPSGIEDTIIAGFANSIGLHITSTISASGGTNVFFVKNSWVNGNNQTGAKPVVLDASGAGVLSSIEFYGGAIENPGVGFPALSINGGGTVAAVNSIGFYGTQVQNNLSNTVAGVSIVDAENVKISDMLFNGQPSGFPCIELNQTVSSGLSSIDLDTIRCSNFASTPVVKNDVTGYSTSSGKYLEPHYFFAGGTHAEALTFDSATNLYPQAVGTHVKLTGQTASVSNQTLLSSVPAALYRECVWIVVTSTTATGGTIVGAASYNNGNGGNSTQVTGSVAAQTQWAENASNNSGCRVFRPVAGGTISANSTDTASGGTATYNFEATLEQLTAN